MSILFLVFLRNLRSGFHSGGSDFHLNLHLLWFVVIMIAILGRGDGINITFVDEFWKNKHCIFNFFSYRSLLLFLVLICLCYVTDLMSELLPLLHSCVPES